MIETECRSRHMFESFWINGVAELVTPFMDMTCFWGQGRSTLRKLQPPTSPACLSSRRPSQWQWMPVLPRRGKCALLATLCLAIRQCYWTQAWCGLHPLMQIQFITTRPFPRLPHSGCWWANRRPPEIQVIQRSSLPLPGSLVRWMRLWMWGGWWWILKMPLLWGLVLIPPPKGISMFPWETVATSRRQSRKLKSFLCPLILGGRTVLELHLQDQRRGCSWRQPAQLLSPNGASAWWSMNLLLLQRLTNHLRARFPKWKAKWRAKRRSTSPVFSRNTNNDSLSRVRFGTS